MRKNLLIPLALMALPTFGLAQSFDNLAQVKVLSGWRTDDGTHIAGLEITLEDGWVTYWRAPGDAGIPPQFSFRSPDNIASITPHFPTPEVFGDSDTRSIGYYDAVIFPLTVDLGVAQGPVAVAGELTIGVCEEICIPVTLSFDTILPVKGAYDPVIGAALVAQPLSQDQAGVGAVTCAIDPISDGLRVTATIDVDPAGRSEHVVLEASDPRIWVSQPSARREGGRLIATADMVHPSGVPFALDRSGIRITVLGDDRAIDIRGCSAG